MRRYTTSLKPVNVAALGLNALFVGLHFAQTHVWYDGLAQDVSIFASQGSVVLLLVWVLLMENQRRGLAFGRPAPFAGEVVRFARTYHGYLFAWAIVFTFWFHPLVATPGHLVGFFYMFLLLVQGSLFFTRAHLNRWWTVSLEVLVLAHGALVAAVAGNGLWPMFAFGFGAVFVITQMHGLGLSRGVRLALERALRGAGRNCLRGTGLGTGQRGGADPGHRVSVCRRARGPDLAGSGGFEITSPAAGHAGVQRCRVTPEAIRAAQLEAAAKLGEQGVAFDELSGPHCRRV